MKHLLCVSILAVLFNIASTAVAAEKFYGVAGVGYAQVELDSTDSSGLSYRFAVGKEIHSQWNIELGYQQLVDEEESGLEQGIAAQALTISALGKAGNREGELFYRVGLAYLDVTGLTAASNNADCSLGMVAGINANMDSLCAVDDNLFGGVVGLGFDFYVGLNTMVRVEAEYIYAENDYSTGAIYVGYRHNF